MLRVNGRYIAHEAVGLDWGASVSENKFFNFSSPQFRQRATLIFLWLIIAIAIILVRSVILPFILAALLAYVFQPVVASISKIKIRSRPMPRVASVLLIYLFFAAIFVLIGAVFIPQFYVEMVRLAKDATTFANSIDENTINKIGSNIEDFLRSYDLPVEIIAPSTEVHKVPESPHRSNWISIDLLQVAKDLLNDIALYVKSEAKNIIASAQHIFAQFISGLFMVMLILMITGFLLVDVNVIKKFVFSMVPITDRRSFDSFLHRLDQRLSGVVRGQLIICLVNALLTLVGLLLLNVNFAFTLATIAGILSIVPIFGSIISTVPIVLVALTISPLTALLSLLWVVGIHILEANFLNPKIMGDSAKIHPVLVILALVAGEHFYGIIGALLAVPIMSIIVTIFNSILAKARHLDEGVAKPVRDDTIAP